jgi:hypothetical protein
VYFVADRAPVDTAPKEPTLNTDAAVAVVQPVEQPLRPAASPPANEIEQPAPAATPDPLPKKEMTSSVAPTPVETPRPARPQRELSVTQLKERTISLARSGEIPDAIISLRDLQAKLPGEDDPIVREATASIAQAYAQLAERAVVDGNYTSAIALMSRASEITPNQPSYISRRQQIERIARFSDSLEHGSNLSADTLRDELASIRESEGPQYYTVRSRLASVLVQRVQEHPAGAPAETAALIDLAQQLFGGIPEIDRLQATDQ